METLNWKITGEFITRNVRERLWLNHQPYSEVEELLLSCLICDQITDEEKREIAREILSGKKKLAGTNTFTVEEDNDTYLCSVDLTIDNLLKTIFSLRDQTIRLNNQVAELEAELEEANEELRKNAGILSEYDKLAAEIQEYADANSPIKKLEHHLCHSNMVDLISWNQIFGIVTDQIKQEFVDWCDKYNIFPGKSVYGQWEWYCFYDKDTNKLLDSEDFIRLGIKPVRTKSDGTPKVEIESEEDEPLLEYGWLAPTGDFASGPFGDHERIAFEIIQEKNWEDEYWSESVEQRRTAGDFLVKKGYVLLDCPCGIGRTQITRNHAKRLTKAQKEFLYDYLLKDGQDILANHIMQEE